MRVLFPLYALFLTIFVVFSYLFIDQNLFYLKNLYTGFAYQNRGIVSVAYLLSILIFFAFYYLFLKKINNKELFKLIAVSSLILIFSYPAMLSFDILNYIATAKVLFFYQENPYIIMPIEFVDDPLLLFTRAANKVALYGPIWVISSGIPYLLGLKNFVLTLFNFKVFVTFFYLGNVYLLQKYTKDPKATALFTLSPLVLIETFVSSHNDVVMMFFGLLSITLLMKNKWKLAIFFLLLSVLIKYSTIFLIPVFLYYFLLRSKGKTVDWEKIFLFSYISMLVIFILSVFREEIYPWYGIWFLIFLPFLRRYKFILYFSILISFLLLLRYLPYMYLGNYFGATPIMREALTFVPLLFFLIIYKIKLSKN